VNSLDALAHLTEEPFDDLLGHAEVIDQARRDGAPKPWMVQDSRSRAAPAFTILRSADSKREDQCMGLLGTPGKRSLSSELTSSRRRRST
jgi:hypothetical protein